MTVEFATDASIGDAGFFAEYVVSNARRTGAPLPSLLSSSTAPCGGMQMLVGESGVVSDGPGAYSANMDCRSDNA